MKKFSYYLEMIQNKDEENHANEVHGKDSKESGSKMIIATNPKEMAIEGFKKGLNKEKNHQYIASPAKLWILDTKKIIGKDALVEADKKLSDYPMTIEEANKKFQEKNVEWVLRNFAKIPVRVYKNKISKDAKKLAIIGPDQNTIWTAFPIANENTSISPPLDDSPVSIKFWKTHGFAKQ
jgi:hypothetical protein